ncbi:MAG: hypothetical protein GY953_51425, partial [bacterium]|nr:hypothetical protein [bacterium]
MRLHHVVAALFLLLVANSGYLAAVVSPSLFYMGNVLAHLVLGLTVAAGFLGMLARDAALRRDLRLPAALFGVSAVLGLFLIVAHNTYNNRWALWLHIATAVAGTLALLPYLRRRAAGYEKTLRALVCAAAVLAVAMVALNGAAGPDQAIHNPTVTPLSMEEEGAGPDSPFWPSSADTSVGGVVPSEFFLSSERCGECHIDIYEQWKSSVHHFSSFNNRFYAASIEHMQEIAGTKGSRWCAGCHDHAMLFSGKFD